MAGLLHELGGHCKHDVVLPFRLYSPFKHVAQCPSPARLKYLLHSLPPKKKLKTHCSQVWLLSINYIYNEEIGLYWACTFNKL